MKFRAIVFLLLLLNLHDTFGQKKAPQPDLIDTVVYKVVDVYPVSIIHEKEVDFEEVHKFVQANLTWNLFSKAKKEPPKVYLVKVFATTLKNLKPWKFSSVKIA